MRRFFNLLICVILLLSSCTDPNINITREYIYNESWKKQGEVGLRIIKLIIPDTILKNVNNKKFKFKQIERNHQLDSTFDFSIEYQKELYIDKVYFDKKQGNITWIKSRNWNDKRKKIGKLELNTWYRFENLYESYTFYAFVDGHGEVYVYNTERPLFGV